MKPPVGPIPVAEWLDEGRKLFGNDKTLWSTWRFKCPVCGHVQTPADFEALGIDPQKAYQECIGRHLKSRASNLGSTPGKDGNKSPCDYAVYGLFRLGSLVIPEGGGAPVPVFPFTDEPPVSRAPQKDLS